MSEKRPGDRGLYRRRENKGKRCVPPSSIELSDNRKHNCSSSSSSEKYGTAEIRQQLQSLAHASKDIGTAVLDTLAPTTESVQTKEASSAMSRCKSSADFFNLARKLLVVDETCNLVGLESLIVSAVDAANLLQRSKLATITRIQTAALCASDAEPKKKSVESPLVSSTPRADDAKDVEAVQHTQAASTSVREPKKKRAGSPLVVSTSRTDDAREVEAVQKTQVASTVRALYYATSSPTSDSSARVRLPTRETRRARIVITLKRIPENAQWLLKNPHRLAAAAEGEFMKGKSKNANLK